MVSMLHTSYRKHEPKTHADSSKASCTVSDQYCSAGGLKKGRKRGRKGGMKIEKKGMKIVFKSPTP